VTAVQDTLSLGEVDRDGALVDAIAAVHGDTRAEFLRKAAIGSGALLAAAAAVPSDARAGGLSTDRRILNFFLAFEHLQVAFYRETAAMKVLKGELARQADVVGAHERAHARALTAAVGRRAAKPGRYDFRGTTEDPLRFQRTAVAFEDLTTAALQGQTARLRSPEFVSAAVAILIVEARHAAWIRRLAGAQPATDAFNEAVPLSRVTSIVDRTHFVVRRTVQTRSRRRGPRFIG
jgi:Ferritin-like domain